MAAPAEAPSSTPPDVEALCRLDFLEPIPADVLMQALTSAPFVHVPGTFNTRDLGLVPATSRAEKALRPGFAFRSGALDGLTRDGKAVLAEQIGVRRIFDVRSMKEYARSPDPAVPGAENVWLRTEEQDALVKLGPFVSGQGEEGYTEMYMDVLQVYLPPIRAVLEHVRDFPEQPFLFHCTAGRDRTGVIAGLLETLAGDSAEAVALGFILSRVGTEPARDALVAFAKHGSGAASVDAPGFRNLCNLKTVCWDAFVAKVQEVYGGFDGYVVKTLGFSDEDLAKIKHNLRAEPGK